MVKDNRHRTRALVTPEGLEVNIDTQQSVFALVGSIQEEMAKAGGKLVESIALFDIYRGPQVGENKKSVSIRVTLRASDRTLKDDEIDNAIKKVLKALDKIGVTLRQ